ncbi:MAG: bacterial transcriptional activator domain-containing protein [bacterium]
MSWVAGLRLGPHGLIPPPMVSGRGAPRLPLGEPGRHPRLDVGALHRRDPPRDRPPGSPHLGRPPTFRWLSEREPAIAVRPEGAPECLRLLADEADPGLYAVQRWQASWSGREATADAPDATHLAEAALQAGDPRAPYGPSAVAHHIARRPILPGEEGRSIEERRDLVTLMPFQESGYCLLIRAHADAGNRAEVLRAYEECQELLAEELGVGPAPTVPTTSALRRSPPAGAGRTA